MIDGTFCGRDMTKQSYFTICIVVIGLLESLQSPNLLGFHLYPTYCSISSSGQPCDATRALCWVTWPESESGSHGWLSGGRGVAQGQPLMSQILIDSQLPPPLGFDISDSTSGWEPTGHLAVRGGSMVSVACFPHCF